APRYGNPIRAPHDPSRRGLPASPRAPTEPARRGPRRCSWEVDELEGRTDGEADIVESVRRDVAAAVDRAGDGAAGHTEVVDGVVVGAEPHVDPPGEPCGVQNRERVRAVAAEPVEPSRRRAAGAAKGKNGDVIRTVAQVEVEAAGNEGAHGDR